MRNIEGKSRSCNIFFNVSPLMDIFFCAEVIFEEITTENLPKTDERH